jgi:hypothetical protein
LRPSLDSGMSTYGVIISNINCVDLSCAYASQRFFQRCLVLL